MKAVNFLILLFVFASCLEPVPVQKEVEPADALTNKQEDTQPVGLGDPLLTSQWHLNNFGQSVGTAGFDLNMRSLYTQGVRGEGITVAVVDDGLQIAHPDLASNIASGRSYNYTNGSNDPTPGPDFGHGTACAGIIASRDDNGLGGRGVAPRAELVGYNVLTDYNAANAYDALTRNKYIVDVSSNSWGPPDGYGSLVAPEDLWKQGIEEGLNTGRAGRGTVYVWAAGNGGLEEGIVDLSTFDGYASHHGVIAVAAFGSDGKYATYSELGANVWITAPSLGDNDHAITTTDLTGSARGYNKGLASDHGNTDYTNTFNGTSAAAPMVSGVVALMLGVNPDLGYRDVREILAKTADKIDPTNQSWIENGAGIDVSYTYGFGSVNTDAAVAAARTWSNLPAQLVREFPLTGAQTVETLINDDGTAVSSDIVISSSGISNIEFIELEVNMEHTDWGNLDIRLVRQGDITTESVVAVPHPCANQNFQIVDCSRNDNTFTFGIARHLDEPADGTWRLIVTDAEASDAKDGTLNSWRLKIYGH